MELPSVCMEARKITLPVNHGGQGQMEAVKCCLYSIVICVGAINLMTSSLFANNADLKTIVEVRC